MSKAQAQETNITSIEKTIHHYFDGMIKHDSTSIKKAFTPSATMKWIEDGEHIEENAISALSEYFEANKPSKSIPSITAINVKGNAANVTLEIEYEAFTFVDYMHLLRINNRWMVVSKTYTTIPKEF